MLNCVVRAWSFVVRKPRVQLSQVFATHEAEVLPTASDHANDDSSSGKAIVHAQAG